MIQVKFLRSRRIKNKPDTFDIYVEGTSGQFKKTIKIEQNLAHEDARDELKKKIGKELLHEFRSFTASKTARNSINDLVSEKPTIFQTGGT